MWMSLRSLFFLLLGVSWCRGVDVPALTGSNVTFTTDVSDGPSEITWYKDTTKIVELMKGKAPYFYRLVDRVIADLQTGTFILKSVTLEDGGQYKAERVVEGIFSDEYFRLLVQGPVCKVEIHNTTVENNVTLRCSCPKQNPSPPKYKWVNQSDHVVSEDRPLTVQKTKQPQQYRCEASNDVSTSKAIVTVPALTEPSGSLPAGAVVAIVIILLLLVAVGLVLWKLKKLRCVINRSGRGTKDNGNRTENPINPEEVNLRNNAEQPNSP